MVWGYPQLSEPEREQLGQVESDPECETLKENVGGEMGFGLADLHLKDLLTASHYYF